MVSVHHARDEPPRLYKQAHLVMCVVYSGAAGIVLQERDLHAASR